MSSRIAASPRFLIRPARPDDRTAILALIPRLHAFGPPPLRDVPTMDARERRTIDEFFESCPEGARLWVAADDASAVLGAAYAEPASDYFTEEPHGHLGILVVAGEAEGRGVGGALIVAVERWATDAGYRYLTLNVFADNQRARAVYERSGYRADTMRLFKPLTT